MMPRIPIVMTMSWPTIETSLKPKSRMATMMRSLSRLPMIATIPNGQETNLMRNSMTNLN